MENENWKLPDGSEIRVTHEEDSSFYNFEDGSALISCRDPEILALVEELRQPWEAADAVFTRLIEDGLSAIKEREQAIVSEAQQIIDAEGLS